MLRCAVSIVATGAAESGGLPFDGASGAEHTTTRNVLIFAVRVVGITSASAAGAVAAMQSETVLIGTVSVISIALTFALVTAALLYNRDAFSALPPLLLRWRENRRLTARCRCCCRRCSVGAQ